ncbi:MAG: sugar phosphate isomerase/epimerase [Planctomycetaceae bacterium]|nr:sugar phosphate isomerase/epimerase [Planctomycetaceae bacterium]
MSASNTSSGSGATRRNFLQSISGVAVTAGVAATTWTGSVQPAQALEPIVRNGKSHLKLSLAAYSFRDLLGGKQPKMTMLEFIDKCAEYNLDGCELTSYWFPETITPDYLMQIKQRAFRLGLDISGTAIRNDFCLPAGAERDKWLAHTRDWINYSATFGAPVIRVFAGNVAKDSNEAEAVERCVAGLRESLEHAAKQGVFLALENHGGITATADQLLKIVKQVDSPWFGVNFDSGNFSTGGDPYEQLARIAPYAVNAQLKTEINIGGKKVPADLPRIVKILRDANFRGYIVLEYEAAEDPLVAVPRHLQELRALIS